MESRSLKLQIWPMRCISFDQISICFLKIYTNLPPAPQNWDFCLLWKNWILWQHWACTVFVIPFRCTVSFQFASILFCYLPVLVSFTCFFGDWRDLVFGPWIWGIAELYILQLWSITEDTASALLRNWNVILSTRGNHWRILSREVT